MFEVDPNLWLQSFAAPWLTWLMRGISALGYEWFYAAVVLGVGFAARLRPMLGVLLALLLAALCTIAAKDGLRLPRPVQVDARVLDEGRVNAQWQVERGGATSFASLPSADAIAAQRAAADPDYGFVSGHVAGATAFCLGLWLCFGVRSRRARAALLAWPLLMLVSRMYLGRHFLGDVAGGLATGTAAAVAAWWLWQPGRAGALAAVALAACLASLAFPIVPRGAAGQLLGLAAAAWLFARAGFPADAAPWPMRLGRVLIAVGFYLLAKVAVSRIAIRAGWPEGHPMDIVLAGLALLLVIAGTVALARRLGWYRDVGTKRDAPGILAARGDRPDPA